jgi:hypothetical protein
MQQDNNEDANTTHDKDESLNNKSNCDELDYKIN